MPLSYHGGICFIVTCGTHCLKVHIHVYIKNFVIFINFLILLCSGFPVPCHCGAFYLSRRAVVMFSFISCRWPFRCVWRRGACDFASFWGRAGCLCDQCSTRVSVCRSHGDCDGAINAAHSCHGRAGQMGGEWNSLFVGSWNAPRFYAFYALHLNKIFVEYNVQDDDFQPI